MDLGDKCITFKNYDPCYGETVAHMMYFSFFTLIFAILAIIVGLFIVFAIIFCIICCFVEIAKCVINRKSKISIQQVDVELAKHTNYGSIDSLPIETRL